MSSSPTKDVLCTLLTALFFEQRGDFEVTERREVVCVGDDAYRMTLVGVGVHEELPLGRRVWLTLGEYELDLSRAEGGDVRACELRAVCRTLKSVRLDDIGEDRRSPAPFWRSLTRARTSIDADDTLTSTSDLFGWHRAGMLQQRVPLRVTTLCVAVDGRWPSYARSDSNECDACTDAGGIRCATCCEELAATNGRWLDAMLRFATYDFVSVEPHSGSVRSVDLDGGALATSSGTCSDAVLDLAQAAAAKLDADPSWRWSSVDVPYYYLPEHALPSSCAHVLGMCYVGLLHTTNLKVSDWSRVRVGCFTTNDVTQSDHGRRRRTTAAAATATPTTAVTQAHELGHMLGLLHSAGAGDERPSCTRSDGVDAQCLLEYGDPYSIMGSWGFHDNPTLSAIARYDWGVLPSRRVATPYLEKAADTTVVELLQLSSYNWTTTHDGATAFAAVALRCRACRQRSDEVMSELVTGGGDLWVTLRGGTDYVPEWSRGLGHGFDRSRDSVARQNVVVVEYRPSTVQAFSGLPGWPRSQLWYWLRQGESFSPKGGGPCITAQRIDAATLSSPARALVRVASHCGAEAFGTNHDGAHDDEVVMFVAVALGVVCFVSFMSCVAYATVYKSEWWRLGPSEK